MAPAGIITTSPEELAERIDRAHARFAGLLAGLPDTLPVGDRWTTVDVAAHLVNVVNRYVDFSPDRLADAPRGVDAINEQELAQLAGRSLGDVLAELDAEMSRFRAAWGPHTGLPLELDLPFHGGGAIDLQGGLTNLLGEYLIHGLDVARAADADWKIDERDGALLCAFGARILPAYVRKTNTERILLRFDLDGLGPWVLDVDGATAEARAPQPGEQPDVAFGGAATPMALVFYGRLGVDAALDAGLQVCDGTRPERAGVLPELFEAP